MRDYIFIKDLKVPIKIGCFEEERERTQDIEISCKIFSDTTRAADSKNIRDTVCYKETSYLILALAKEKPYVLLEEFGELVIENIFARFKSANGIEISLTKFVIPEAKGVGVSMVRVRS